MNEPLDTVIDVETPEHVMFRHRAAGPSRRAAAYLLDLLARGLILLAIAIPLSLAGKSSSQGLLLLVAFLVEWLYYVVSEALSNGRSLGKWALGLRVVRDGGQPPSFVDIVLRNLLRGADFLPLGYAVGLVVAARDARFRRLGDMVAGTLVVVAESPRPLTRPPGRPPRPEELARLPRAPSLTVEEWDALDLFVRRVDIAHDRRQELAAMIAPTLAARLSVPVGADPLRFLELLHMRVHDATVGAHIVRGADERLFVAERQSDWSALAVLLERGAMHRLPSASLARALTLHRALMADLARARSKRYGAELVLSLDALAARSHAAMYTAPPRHARALSDFFVRDFPRALRRRGRLLLFATALFVLPGVVGFAGAYGSRSFAAHILPAETMQSMEQAYSGGFGSGRELDTNLGMAGFYVANNVGIAFRCFATGVFFGLGSVFFLFYNGLVIGAVLGLVAAAGSGRNIFTFICGHGPLELTAIVIAGVAGLHLGLTLVDPGGYTRLGALRLRAREIAQLVMGAAAMLLLAAAVEGFWSPSSLGDGVKWAASGTLSVLLIIYFCAAGRRPAGAT